MVKYITYKHVAVQSDTYSKLDKLRKEKEREMGLKRLTFSQFLDTLYHQLKK